MCFITQEDASRSSQECLRLMYLQKDLKIPSQRAASKILLTPRMRKKRLQFTLRFLRGSVGAWTKGHVV